MKTHRAFMTRSAFQASPLLAIQDADNRPMLIPDVIPPAPKPPKPPPATALAPILPKPPPKSLLDNQGRAQLDSDGLVKCEGGLRAKPFASDGYVPPKPQTALDILLAQPEFLECAIGGVIKGLMTGRQAHILSAALLSDPKESVCMTAYTFGEDDAGGPLIQALGRAARFVAVRVLVDERETLRGKTKRQAQCLWNLVQLGVQVELVKKVKGQQHSKSLLIGSCLLLGSTNWTSNSRNNHEMSLAVSSMIED